MALRPLFDRILVRPDSVKGPAPLVNPGGVVVIPDAAMDKLNYAINALASRGEIVAVGPGRWRTKRGREHVRIQMTAQVGDRVLYKHMAGQRDVEIAGVPHVILTSEQVMAQESAA